MLLVVKCGTILGSCACGKHYSAVHICMIIT